MSNRLEQVRAMLAASGRPYEESAKRAAVDYAKARSRAGVGSGRVARELGVSAATLSVWLRPSVLVPVEVIQDGTATLIGKSHATLVLVDARRGLRIEGLSVDDVVHVLGRLP